MIARYLGAASRRLIMLFLLVAGAAGAQEPCEVSAAGVGDRVTLDTGRTLLVSANSEGLLLPLLIEKLNQLSLADSTRGAVFGRVINLNSYFSLTEQQQRTREALTYFTTTNYELPAGLQSAAELLVTADYFLLVRVNVVGEMLELQLEFYQRAPEGCAQTPGSHTAIIPTQDITGPGRAISVFIDPRDALYELAVENALSRLFFETDAPPEAAISLNGIRAQADTTYVIAFGDTVEIDARHSTDRDTPRDRFRYLWRQVGNRAGYVNVDPAFVLGLDASPTAERQQVLPPAVGMYRVGLTVNDQILDSPEEAIVAFEVIRRPVLQSSRPRLEVRDPVNLARLGGGLLRRLGIGGTSPARDSVFVTVSDFDPRLDQVCLRSEDEVVCGGDSLTVDPLQLYTRGDTAGVTVFAKAAGGRPPFFAFAGAPAVEREVEVEVRRRSLRGVLPLPLLYERGALIGVYYEAHAGYMASWSDTTNSTGSLHFPTTRPVWFGGKYVLGLLDEVALGLVYQMSLRGESTAEGWSNFAAEGRIGNPLEPPVIILRSFQHAWEYEPTSPAAGGNNEASAVRHVETVWLVAPGAEFERRLFGRFRLGIQVLVPLETKIWVPSGIIVGLQVSM